jgi:hypothetical protein
MKSILFALSLIALLPFQAATATTLVWGSTAGDLLYTSYGDRLDDSFIFEIGTFGSFTPTLANASEWEENWKIFDRALAPFQNGWNSGAGYFTSEATLLTNGTSDSTHAEGHTFMTGEQIYIWTYNTLNYGPGSEWALITNDSSDNVSGDNWVMPDPNCCGENNNAIIDLRVEDATRVPVGGVNDERGGGTFYATPPAYQLQTAAVPEPGAGLLLSVLGLGLLLRRQRK